MSYSLLSESFPVARKQHRCIWCGETIPVGLKHRHERSVYDGGMQDHRWHMECDAAFKEDLRSGGDDEFIPHSAERPQVAVGVGPHDEVKP
jgi:hypothetical protein